jgi:phage baseplate assembly protein W
MSDLFNRALKVPRTGVGEANLNKFPYGRSYPYGRFAATPSLENPLSKSWLFEVVDRKSERIIESFTLIMPPQSYSIKESQRVSITKTFGNAFVDDYGPDNLQITLKGISGTSHAFPTYRTRGPAKTFTDIGEAVSGASDMADNSFGYTGKTAFYEFRNTIMRYKDWAKGAYDKYELRVYDLADEQAYKCVLLEFSVDRTSDNPLRYPYSISLFVYERLDALRVLTRTDVPKISKNPIAALDEADSLLDKIQNLYRDVMNVVNQAALLKARVLELRTRYNKFVTQTTQGLTSPLDISKNLIDTAFSAIGVAYDTYHAGKYTLERYIGSVELFRSTLNQGLRLYGFQISSGWQTERNVQLEVDNGVNTKSNTVERNIDYQSYTYSGLNVYTVRGEDTLQSIASDQLGDENLWPYIASVNSGISSNNDLVAGEEIFIPVQIETDAEANKEQFILTEDITRDPYGTDIRLDQNGNIVIQENGDTALVSGLQNVEQAVDLILNTPSGSMIKQTAYGITAQAGIAGTDIAIKYLKIAIRAALVKDPRIASVTNMVVSLGSDVLNISMNINVVGIEESLPITIET